MKLRLALGTLVLLLGLAACGGGGRSPAQVVRAWSRALKADDNQAAGSLFAPGAEVVQGDSVVTLRTHEDAVAWNAALPCSGEIVALHTDGEQATATFLLGDRRSSKCDAPGAEATALFRVHGGKIVLWHQTGSTSPADQTV